MPCSGSREPLHCTKTTSLGTLPSEGRSTLPAVGPLAASRRSKASPSITSGISPPPYSGRRGMRQQVVAGGHHDRADLLLDDRVLLLPVDRAGRAELGARAALGLGRVALLVDCRRTPCFDIPLALQVAAVLGVDHRLVGHSLGREGVDHLALAHPALEVRLDLEGALLLAHAAAGAHLPIDVGGLAADAAR